MFAGPSLTTGHRENWDEKGLASFLSVNHTLIHIKLQFSAMIFFFLKQVLYLNSFRQLVEKSKFLLCLLLLKNNQLKMIDIPKGIFSDGKLCPSLSISVAGESQKSLLCCYFLLCSNVSLGDHFLLFLSEMHLRAFNICIQKTHSFALGEFLLPLVLVWHVVGTGNQIVISIQRLIISSMGNIIIYKVSEKDL